MDRQSERPPTHLSAHSMKCSDAAAAALGVGWCFLQALLPLSRSIVLIPLLSADLHKSDSKPIKKKTKKETKSSFFNNDIMGLLKPAGKESQEKSSLTGESLPLSEAASFQWACDSNKECVFKRWLNFKALCHAIYCLLENHWFSPLSTSLSFTRFVQKVHNIVTMLSRTGLP